MFNGLWFVCGIVAELNALGMDVRMEKVKKFRGNAVRFLRLFGSFEFRLILVEMKGSWVVCVPRSACFLFAPKSPFVSLH